MPVASTPLSDTSVAAGDPAAWRQHCLALLARPSRFATIPDLMTIALRAFTEGLGVSECWVALYNARDRQLMITASAGFPAEQRLVGQRLGDSRNTAPGDWLGSAARHDMDAAAQVRYASLLPATLRSISRERVYHLLPLLLNGHLLGLVYICSGPQRPLLDDKRATALIRTVDCLLKALEAFKTKA